MREYLQANNHLLNFAICPFINESSAYYTSASIPLFKKNRNLNFTLVGKYLQTKIRQLRAKDEFEITNILPEAWRVSWQKNDSLTIYVGWIWKLKFLLTRQKELAKNND